ncbi:hypothetical protein LCGC14_3147770, partial [marine sediment metagenome]
PIDNELFIHPKKISKDFFKGIKRSGDCDDYSLLSAAMLMSVGFESKIILIDAEMSGEIDHALAQVKLKELGWTNFDTTSSRPLGWIIPHTMSVSIEAKN